MKIIFDVLPDFSEGLPAGMDSIGFNAENKPVFECDDIPDGGRLAGNADLVGLPDAAKHFAKMLVRDVIHRDVADVETLLGTVTDAMQVLVLFACTDAVALASSDDFSAYKKMRMDALAALSGGDAGAADMVKNAETLLSAVLSGDVIMPFLVKQDKATGVFRDVGSRATAVARVLMSSTVTSGVLDDAAA